MSCIFIACNKNDDVPADAIDYRADFLGEFVFTSIISADAGPNGTYSDTTIVFQNGSIQNYLDSNLAINILPNAYDHFWMCIDSDIVALPDTLIPLVKTKDIMEYKGIEDCYLNASFNCTFSDDLDTIRIELLTSARGFVWSYDGTGIRK